MLQRQPFTITLFAFLFLSGVSVQLFATRWGIGLSPDSLTYLGAAHQLRNGLSFSLPTPDGGREPLGWYAPLFSAVVAAGLLCLLLFSRGRHGAKLVRSAIFLAISTLPMTLWMVRTRTAFS